MLILTFSFLQPFFIEKKYQPVCPLVLESILRKRSNSLGEGFITQSRLPD